MGPHRRRPLAHPPPAGAGGQAAGAAQGGTGSEDIERENLMAVFHQHFVPPPDDADLTNLMLQLIRTRRQVSGLPLGMSLCSGSDQTANGSSPRSSLFLRATCATPRSGDITSVLVPAQLLKGKKTGRRTCLGGGF